MKVRDLSHGATDSRFGPSLPALLGGLWRRSGPFVRLTIVAAAGLAAAALAFAVASRLERSSFDYDGPRAPAFSIGHDGLERVEPRPREIARFEHREGGRLWESLTISPLRFRSSRNPVSTGLALAASRLAESRRAQLPGYREALEGRTKLGIMEGLDAYMVAFTARSPLGGPAPERLLGKLLLVPADAERSAAGVAIELLQVSDDDRVLAAARDYPAAFFLNWPVNFWLDLAVSVRVPDRLEQALESFEFG